MFVRKSKIGKLAIGTAWVSFSLFTPLSNNSLPMFLCIDYVSKSACCLGVSTYLPFLFTDPQLMERAQTGKDAASQPSTVPTLRRVARGVNLDLKA